MEYQKIDENTIRCIVTERDMENFGINIDEFLTHTKKSDEFLRYIVEEAREELGYQTTHGLISMRVEIMEDKRISITFAGSDEASIREQMISRLKMIFPNINRAVLEGVLEELANIHETEKAAKLQSLLENMAELNARGALPENTGEKRGQAATALQQDPYRLYSFDSMDSVIRFCQDSGIRQPVKSHLFKVSGRYYLLVLRYRISDAKFNLLTLCAFDYGKVHFEVDSMLKYIEEHGEIIIQDKAFGTLRKIG
ncbi:MAG: adaptor protein MecA [Lachnospiraceae bacterium]|nr:adaptor protein MecA [Lachnospiraceae bacterium]